MRNSIMIIVCVISFLSVKPVAANDLKSSLLASSCAACHGTNGHSVGGLPSLSGLAPEYFIEQMQQFSSGQRMSTVMSHHARGYTKQEVKLMAKYFYDQKKD